MTVVKTRQVAVTGETQIVIEPTSDKEAKQILTYLEQLKSSEKMAFVYTQRNKAKKRAARAKAFKRKIQHTAAGKKVVVLPEVKSVSARHLVIHNHAVFAQAAEDKAKRKKNE